MIIIMGGIVKNDIGGDEQRILSMHPIYSKITFKLLFRIKYNKIYSLLKLIKMNKFKF